MARDIQTDATRWYDHFSKFSETFVHKHNIVETDPVVVRWKSRIGLARSMSVSQIVTTIAFSSVVHAVIGCDRTLALLTHVSPAVVSVVYGPDGTSVVPGSRATAGMVAFLALLTLPIGYTYAKLDNHYQPGDKYHSY
jgi:hypothetical protein